MMKMHKVSAGFTLIELLVVIGVIGVLTTGLVIAINPAGQIGKGRDTTRKSDLSKMQAALEMYRYDNGSYPLNNAETVNGAAVYDLGSCNTAFVAGTTQYLANIPCDPLYSTTAANNIYWNGGTYYYFSGGTTYTLATCLENASDTSPGTQASLPSGNPNPGAPLNSCPRYYVAQNQ